MLPVSPHQTVKLQHGLQHEHSVFTNAKWHKHECIGISMNAGEIRMNAIDADDTDLLTIDNHLMPKTSGKTETGGHPRRHAL